MTPLNNLCKLCGHRCKKTGLKNHMKDVHGIGPIAQPKHTPRTRYDLDFKEIPLPHQNKRKEAKVAQGYMDFTPVCQNCRHYVGPRVIMLHRSITKETLPTCRHGLFDVTPRGSCDEWQGLDGSVLEARVITKEQK